MATYDNLLMIMMNVLQRSFKEACNPYISYNYEAFFTVKGRCFKALQNCTYLRYSILIQKYVYFLAQIIQPAATLVQCYLQ